MLEDDFVNAIALPVVDREISFSTLFLSVFSNNPLLFFLSLLSPLI
jgi:hypothetical protein